MSWTTPRTWVTSELVTASVMNAHVRDQFLEIAKLSQYRCYAYNNTGQSVGAGAAAALGLNSEIYDPASMHNTVTNNSRITVPIAGLFRVFGRSSVSSVDNGGVSLTLRKNGSVLTPNVAHGFVTNATNFEDQDMQVTTEIVLAVNDYLELWGSTASNAFTFQSTQLI